MIGLINGFAIQFTVGPNLSATGQFEYYASWMDLNGAGPPVGCTNGTNTVASSTTVLTPPVLGPLEALEITEITIWNNDTVPNLVYISIQPPVAGFIIYQAVLPPQYFLRYNKTAGVEGTWQICEPFGSSKQ